MVRCPKCKTRMVRVAPQRSFTERLVGMLTIYPNRCQICGHRFLAFKGRRSFIPQRSYKRIPVEYPTQFRSAFYKEPTTGLQGTIENLSIAGCRVNSQVRMPLGARLYLQFQVAEGHEPVIIDEAVVRSHPGKGIGLSFTKLRSEEKKRLGRLIRVRGQLSGMFPHRIQTPHAPTARAAN